MDGQRAGDVTQELAAAGGRLGAAVLAGDPAGIAALYEEDAVLLVPGAPPVRGRPAVQGFWWAGIEAGLRALEPVTVALVELDARTAVEVRRTTARAAQDDRPLWTATGAVVHRRGDRGWRCAVEVLTPDGR